MTDAVAQWIDDDPDPVTQAELRHLIEHGRTDELADRFAGTLTFGTAGLRGPVRAGPNGMNRAVVRGAAAGLAAYLDAHGLDGAVVVGYDARNGSAAFADETAAVVAGTGREVHVLPRPLPTPVLAYAVRKLRAAAGVMVTASHNPPADNGYKVYLADGAQIVPPADREIEAAIRAVGPLADVPLGAFGPPLDGSVVDSYVAEVAGLVTSGPLTIAYTPLHGVGADVLSSAFLAAGFSSPAIVEAQAEPDPAFPTVAFPNPEEPGATDLLLALAADIGADIAIANDPDADRCAVAVPRDGSWRMLTGDELGVLLADHLIRRGATGTYATTIVSSSMLRAICADRGVPYAETLTGFKWIVRGAADLAFGYEEALGYAVAPHLVNDKDGISAALLVAELAAQLKADGRTLLDRLHELDERYGRHATSQLAVRVTDLDEIAAMMARLRSALPSTLLGRPTTSVRDLLPDTDAVVLRADGVRVVVRPSGTEPKLKAYLEVVRPGATDLADLRAEVAAVLGI